MSTTVNINVSSAESHINADVTPLNEVVPNAGPPLTLDEYELATVPITLEGPFDPLTLNFYFLRIGRQCTMWFPRVRADIDGTGDTTYIHNTSTPIPERFRPFLDGLAYPVITIGGFPNGIVNNGILVFLADGLFTVRWANTAGIPWPNGRGAVDQFTVTYIARAP